MKLSKIILEMGLNPNDYPKISETRVDVYDWKKRTIKEEEFSFDSCFLSGNSESLQKFREFLDELEDANDIVSFTLHVDRIVIYLKGFNLHTFYR